MIIDDIEAARARGNHRHAGVLKSVLRHFIAERRGQERVIPTREGNQGSRET